MPVRPSHLAALTAALFLYCTAIPVSGAESPFTPSTHDSSETSNSVISDVQAAYQAAWAQRQSGEFEGAIRSTEQGLELIDKAITPDLDATTRRTLVDLRARLAALRIAAKRDAANQSMARANGNDADDRVLNMPAAEEITPQFNAEVFRYIEYFTGAGRSVFERWLKRSGRYMDLFRGVLAKEGLPPDLVHLVFVESGFNINARSISAAVGPWQFLSGTARVFGLTVNKWVDERKDPEKSTVAAARYLKHLYTIFGDWPLALASYNAGEGTVLRAIKRQGTTNYWDLRLPRQTEDYVPQFMAVLAIAHDPEKYGFDSVDLDEPMDFDQIAFKGAVDLHVIAKMADCTYEQLRELNPAVLRGAATGREGVITIRVPRGKGEILMKKLDEGAPLPGVNLTLQHRVRSRETIQSIASQYGVNARQLALANGIGQKHPLRRGVVLTIPASLSARHPEVLDKADPRASTAYVPTRDIRPPAKLNAESNADGRVKVTVRRGMTLASIAEANGCTVEDIMRWNHLTTRTVRRGTRLKIRTGDSMNEEPAVMDSASTAQLAKIRLRPTRRTTTHRQVAVTYTGPHTTIVVQRGETLESIAKRHGVTIAQLKRANGISGSVIRAGQRLRVPTG